MSVPLVAGVLLADDHPIVRHGPRDLLEAEADVRVVAEVDDGTEAVRRAVADDVQLAILDVTMPRMTVFRPRTSCPVDASLRILMLSKHGERAVPRRPARHQPQDGRPSSGQHAGEARHA